MMEVAENTVALTFPCAPIIVQHQLRQVIMPKLTLGTRYSCWISLCNTLKTGRESTHPLGSLTIKNISYRQTMQQSIRQALCLYKVGKLVQYSRRSESGQDELWLPEFVEWCQLASRSLSRGMGDISCGPVGLLSSFPSSEWLWNTPVEIYLTQWLLREYVRYNQIEQHQGSRFESMRGNQHPLITPCGPFSQFQHFRSRKEYVGDTNSQTSRTTTASVRQLSEITRRTITLPCPHVIIFCHSNKIMKNFSVAPTWPDTLGYYHISIEVDIEGACSLPLRPWQRSA